MSAFVPRSILVATDLTVASDATVRSAAALATAADAELHVLHVYEFSAALYGELGPAMTFRDEVAAANRALDMQIARTVAPGQPVASRTVTVHTPHRAIVDHADDVSADLVVLGPASTRARGSWLGTGTVERVIRAARWPCLVVNTPLVPPLRRVVVPMDLSAPVPAAVEHGLRWCTEFGAWSRTGVAIPEAELSVVHVLPPALGMEGVALDRAMIGPELHPSIEAAVAHSEDADGIIIMEEIRWGEDAAEEIVRFAEEERADLLVLAVHERPALRRLIAGSTSLDVAGQAPCAVLLLPPSTWIGGVWSSGVARTHRDVRPERTAAPVPVAV